jgi:hypothetical protein
MRFLIMELFIWPYNCTFLMSKYCPQHPRFVFVLKARYQVLHPYKTAGNVILFVQFNHQAIYTGHEKHVRKYK